MKITISGTLGSGKSTVGKMLAKELGYEYYSTGIIMREMAEKKGMNFVEFNRLAENNKEIDSDIDYYQVNLGKSKENFILEGRLGFHFVPDSVKVFLKCSDEIAAERILKGMNEGDSSRKKEGLKNDKASILSDIKARRDSERKRYKNLYNLNHDDESNFDLVIDTSHIPPEEVCSKILEFIRKNK